MSSHQGDEPKIPVTFLALERLGLEGVELNSEHLNLLMPLIEHSQSLTHLNLSYNRLSSKAIIALLTPILEKDCLKNLNISHNNLSDL